MFALAGGRLGTAGDGADDVEDAADGTATVAGGMGCTDVVLGDVVVLLDDSLVVAAGFFLRMREGTMLLSFSSVMTLETDAPSRRNGRSVMGYGGTYCGDGPTHRGVGGSVWFVCMGCSTRPSSVTPRRRSEPRMRPIRPGRTSVRLVEKDRRAR